MSYPSPKKTEISLTYLLILSIQLKITLKDPQKGKSIVKSMDHTEKCLVGLSIGYNKPVGAEVRSLYSWKTQDLQMKLEISHKRPGQ